ncbi:MAG TPA: GNAT family protein [Roseiflexaceae bacterium]|nr:GNAT family protein [Roseiflexaceae bacterium]
MQHYNHLGQPVGFPLPGWSPPPHPPRTPMAGRFCTVEPLDPERHAAELFAANALDAEGRMWTYLAIGPFATLEEYLAWMRPHAAGSDPLFHAIVDAASGRAVGVASYLRIDPPAGSIEVGHLAFSPLLQRTPAATEAMVLMMQRAFALGYRRYEWKCDALNAASRAAAQRLGLSFEGIFRQATVYKGRNRDTAWYAAIDREWPALEAAFARWLDPSNFDAQGRQRTRLSDLTAPLLARRG